MSYKYVLQSTLSLTATTTTQQTVPSPQFLSCFYDQNNVRINWVQPRLRTNSLPILKYNVYVNNQIFTNIIDTTQFNTLISQLTPFQDQGFQILKFSITTVYSDNSQSRKKSIYLVMMARQIVQIQFDQQNQLSFGDSYQLDLGD